MYIALFDEMDGQTELKFRVGEPLLVFRASRLVECLHWNLRGCLAAAMWGRVSESLFRRDMLGPTFGNCAEFEESSDVG